MITKEARRGGSQVKVTFSLPAGSGGVAVAGDFNQWDGTATPLRKRGGNRSASVTLEAGHRYAFRYLDDAGRWFNDDDADTFEANAFGEQNCVIDLTTG